MFNLLPNILKKEIKNEYYLRRWIIIICSIVFITFSFLILLFPTWLLTFYHEQEVRADVDFQQKFIASQNTKDVLNIINTTNKKLSVINQSFQYPKITPLLFDIIGLKNKGISIRSFSFVTSSASTTSVSLDGLASSREALVSFVRRLEQSPKFSNIISPVSNLTKDSNIEFNLTFVSNQ